MTLSRHFFRRCWSFYQAGQRVLTNRCGKVKFTHSNPVPIPEAGECDAEWRRTFLNPTVVSSFVNQMDRECVIRERKQKEHRSGQNIAMVKQWAMTVLGFSRGKGEQSAAWIIYESKCERVARIGIACVAHQHCSGQPVQLIRSGKTDVRKRGHGTNSATARTACASWKETHLLRDVTRSASLLASNLLVDAASVATDALDVILVAARTLVGRWRHEATGSTWRVLTGFLTGKRRSVRVRSKTNKNKEKLKKNIEF